MMKSDFRQLGDTADMAGSAVLVVGLVAVVVLARMQLGILLVGFGLFGPSVLRESGLLRWRDDFQREVTMRASLHALFVVGLLLTAVMVVEGVGGSGSAEVGWEIKDRISASAIMLPLAMTWWLSRLLQFWGAQSGSRRLLVGLSIVMAILLAFTTARSGSPLRAEKLLISIAQVVWIVALAVGVVRWPRVIGWLLLATAAAQLCGMAGPALQETGEPAWIGVVSELCMWLPIVLPGLALVGTNRSLGETAVAGAGD